MPYEDKIMVASGDSEHPGEEEVGFETIPRRTGEGHTYDLEFNDGLDELTLTEDSSDKTTLPLAATFVGTTAEWESLSALEKANYRLVHFTEDGGIGDASDAVVAFTSSDVVDGNANDWTSVTPITTGLNLKTLWERASMMFKNIRYLFKMLGTADISNIGNGTVTGAISTINSGKVNVSDIKNNLTSTDTNKPLSAAQGKVLNEKNAIYSKIFSMNGYSKFHIVSEFSFGSYSRVMFLVLCVAGGGTPCAYIVRLSTENGTPSAGASIVATGTRTITFTGRKTSFDVLYLDCVLNSGVYDSITVIGDQPFNAYSYN